jgi:hypothetical protein
MSKRSKEQPQAYKVTHPNGFWAIVAAADEFVAKNSFVEEYHYKDSVFDKLKTDLLAKDYPVKTPFFNDKTTVRYVLNTVRFFPRIISDSND